MDKNKINQSLSKLDNKSLIAFIEKPENRGTANRLQAMDELDFRNILPETIREMAIEVNEVIAYERIMNAALAKEEVSMHKSTFLQEQQIRQIYIEQLEKYIKYKDQFRFDVWSYAIGGG